MASETADDPQPKRLIYEMRERVQQARNRVRQEQKRGGLSEGTHLDLAEVVVEYHDVLWEHHDEKPVKDTFPDISDIEATFGELTYVAEEAPGDTDNLRDVAKPGPMAVSTDRLIEASRDLDATAKALGFSASVDTGYDVFGVDPNWDADEEGDA